MVKFLPDAPREAIEAAIHRHPVAVFRFLAAAKAASLQCEPGQEERVCLSMSLEPCVDFMKRIRQGDANHN